MVVSSEALPDCLTLCSPREGESSAKSTFMELKYLATNSQKQLLILENTEKALIFIKSYVIKIIVRQSTINYHLF